jgi:hypothetical protein
MHTFTYSNSSQSSSERSKEIKSSSNWTLERMHLLGKFSNVLLRTLEQWDAFDSPDGGDIGYFFDLEHPFPSESTQSVDNCHAGRSLSAIRKTFVKLHGLFQKIELLRDDLSRDFKTVSGTVEVPWATHSFVEEHISLTTRFFFFFLAYTASFLGRSRCK